MLYFMYEEVGAMWGGGGGGGGDGGDGEEFSEGTRPSV